MRFEILGLNPDILKGITEAGFEHCTPIQEQSLPECLKGKDVIAQSQTGSGKTAVFLITIFSRVLASGSDPSGRPRALVMVPTRELATQVIDDANKLAKHIPFRSVAVYGGVEYDRQIQALKKGVDLVVATPGRMIDLYKSKTLSLDAIDMFVIDEADRMFDMGFAPDIMYIAGKLPRNMPRQTMLFSATIDSNVRRLASRYMLPDPVMVEIEPEQVTVNTIDQKVIYCSNDEKVPILLTLLKRPENERCIIFTNMKRTAEMLGWKLEANGIPAKVITGDLSQERRQKAIAGMKSGTITTLIATDVAARGLHIEGVTHVVNYDLPDDSANYVHRIGRTARAGKSGKAYSLVCEDHVLNLPEIEKYIEKKLESEWIEDSEMVKDAAPPYSGRARRDKPFEKRDRKPGGPDKGSRFASKDRKPGQHASQKAATSTAPVEKKAAAPANAPNAQANTQKSEAAPGERTGRRPRRRRPGGGRPEGGRPDNRPRPDRKPQQGEKSEAAPGPKPQNPNRRPPRPHAERGPRHSEQAAPPPVIKIDTRPEPKAEPKTHQSEPARNEAPEKGGILKRFFKFLKKS